MNDFEAFNDLLSQAKKNLRPEEVKCRNGIFHPSMVVGSLVGYLAKSQSGSTLTTIGPGLAVTLKGAARQRYASRDNGRLYLSISAFWRYIGEVFPDSKVGGWRITTPPLTNGVRDTVLKRIARPEPKIVSRDIFVPRGHGGSLDSYR